MGSLTIIQLLLLVAVAASLASGQSTLGGSTFVIIPVEDEVQTTNSPAETVETVDAAILEDNASGGCPSLASNLLANPGIKNGTRLSLLLALPLTYKGEAYLNPGFFQLASALMAMDHFNERKTSIIPELADFQECPIQIDYDSLLVMDTGTIESNAMSTLMNAMENRTHLPSAIVGPYNEIPATELSVLASAMQIPMVTHRGLDHNLLLPNKHPFVSQVNPDLYADMLFLGDYLQHTGRTDYIAVLYAASADSAIQRLEVFRGVAQSLHMKHVQSFGYVSTFTPVDSHHPSQNITTAMKNLKASGYRTIVWLTPFFDEDMQPVGRAARKYRLDQGDHFWVIGTAINIDKPLESPSDNETDWGSEEGWGSAVTRENGLDMENMDIEDLRVEDLGDLHILDTEFNAFDDVRFMRNAAFLKQAELLDVRDPNHSPFMAEWTELNDSFVERMLQLNPVETQAYHKEWKQYKFLSPMLGWVASKDFPAGQFPPKDLFSKPVPFLSTPPSGALNLYDAIMATGMGACRAFGNTKRVQEDARTVADTEDVSAGELLQQGIRSVNFSGASGTVQFGDGYPGSRMGSTVSYEVVNLFPSGFFSDLYTVSEVRNASDMEWYEINPFVYAGGSMTPPEPLRDEADQNYLSKGVRIAGLTLMGTALLSILASFIWVVVYRHHSIVVASQPVFLYFICLGSSLTALAILFLSFDESHGWDAKQLTATCKAVPWLVVLGHIWTYNCLFTKLWRVNRVLQFSRRKVNLMHVLWPSWLIELAAIILLSVWTATTDFHWDRYEVDETTGESMGECSGEKEYAFWIPISILVMIPTFLTGLMAFKTIDVDAAYSEAKWIFALMLVQCQVIVVSVPMLFILGDVSADGRFLGSSLILWTFPMTTILLIFVPKMVAVHFPPDARRESRGASGRVRVSGLATSAEDKSALSTAHFSGPSHVSTGQSDGSAMTQSAVSALTQSNRHSLVTVH